MMKISTILGICFTLLSIPLFGQQVQYWQKLPNPTNHTLSRVYFIDSLRGWITGQNGVLMQTTDGGTKWKQQISGTTGEVPDLFVRTELDLWALEYIYPVDDTSWFGTHILHSTNGGESWSIQRFDSAIFRTIMFQDSLTGFMGGSYGRIVKTTDGGVNWYTVSDSATHKFPIYTIRFFSREYGYAVGGQLEIAGIIWRTTDGGETWRSRIVSGDPVFNIHYFDSSHVLTSMGDIDQAGAGFLRTEDGGETWSFENTTIWGEPTTFAYRTESEGWVPMGIAGMCLKTIDEGRTWQQIVLPQQIPVYDISFPDQRTGFMVGHKGALYKFNSSVLSVRQQSQNPVSLSLFQNFPNPFNGETVIKYHLSDPSTVKLEIFDAVGRSMEILLDEVQIRGGHTVRWDSKQLSSGMYFYRLSVNGLLTQKKMILLR